ncbi:MAG: cytochrome c [Gammaproteobacteria bacterium]|nr:cytochrome c [Gammaproteobacteria bacterium]
MKRLLFIVLFISAQHLYADDNSKLVERGNYLTSLMLCKGCHTPASSAYQWQYSDSAKLLSGGMKIDFPPFGIFYTKNLTPNSETGIGLWSDADIENAVRHGIGRDGRGLFVMPSNSFAHLKDEDMAAITQYLRSVKPIYHVVPQNQSVSVWRKIAAGLRIVTPFVENPSQDWYYGDSGTFDTSTSKKPESFLPKPSKSVLEVPPAANGNPAAARGRYIAILGLCVGCHTPVGASGPNNELFLAGGFTVQDPSCGTLYSSNLTPDKETGIGQWTDLELARAIREGTSRKGRKLCDIVMPSSLYASMTDQDLSD